MLNTMVMSFSRYELPIECGKGSKLKKWTLKVQNVKNMKVLKS